MEKHALHLKQEKASTRMIRKERINGVMCRIEFDPQVLWPEYDEDGEVDTSYTGELLIYPEQEMNDVIKFTFDRSDETYELIKNEGSSKFPGYYHALIDPSKIKGQLVLIY